MELKFAKYFKSFLKTDARPCPKKYVLLHTLPFLIKCLYFGLRLFSYLSAGMHVFAALKIPPLIFPGLKTPTLTNQVLD